MKSQLLNAVLAQAPADATKALGTGVQTLNSEVKSVSSSVSTLKKIWLAVSPYLVWVLAALAVAALVFVVWKWVLPWWRRRSGAAAASSGGPPSLDSGRL